MMLIVVTFYLGLEYGLHGHDDAICFVRLCLLVKSSKENAKIEQN